MLNENIFYSLLNDAEFFKIAFPFIKGEYFQETNNRILFNKIKQYYDTYSKQPTKNDVKLAIETDSVISEEDSDKLYSYLDSLNLTINNKEFLLKETEQWCQTRALEDAILDSVEIIKKNKNKGMIEDIVKKALSVEFTTKIGHDYFKNAPERFEYYTLQDQKIPCDIELINTAVGGGFVRKALYVFAASTNVGKSLVKCHLATSFLKQGFNVLYITAEMSEEMVSQRLDANMLDIGINELNPELDKKVFLGKVKELAQKMTGKLLVKGYGTGQANSIHVRNLLDEIKRKKGFIPDVVFFDYLNIFSSYRLDDRARSNSYLYIKSIAEEIRALSQEYNFIAISSTQTNRGAINKGTETDMADTSESFGLPATVDSMLSLISTPELFSENKFIVKVLKSRFMDNINQYYTIGVNRIKMRLVNLDESEQAIPIHIKDKLKSQSDAINKRKTDEEIENLLSFD